MPVDRELPTQEAADLIALTRELADAELAPRAAEHERAERFPREVFRTLGAAGLLGLPYAEEYGGAGQPYEVYLQVVEELAAAWLAVALGVSVHTLACYPLAAFGSDEQRRRLLPDMLGGDLLVEGQAQQPGVAEQPEHVAGEALLPLVDGGLRRELGVGELAGQGDEVRRLLGGQLAVDRHATRVSTAPLKSAADATDDLGMLRIDGVDPG